MTVQETQSSEQILAMVRETGEEIGKGSMTGKGGLHW